MTITLTLTQAEARAMQYALGNSTDHPDVMESLFNNGASRGAAYRAAEKLAQALRQGKDGGR